MIDLVISSLRDIRMAKDKPTNNHDHHRRQQLAIDVTGSKHDLLEPPPALPSPMAYTPISEYAWMNPSSFDRVVKEETKADYLTKGMQSPSLSISLPGSSMGSLFEIPPKTPVSKYNKRMSSGNRSSGSHSVRSPISSASPASSCASFDSPISNTLLCELPSRTSVDLSTSACVISQADLDLPMIASELLGSPVSLPSPAEVVTKVLSQPLNKPSFRTFCRNRLMSYSPVAPNPFMWDEANGHFVCSPA